MSSSKDVATIGVVGRIQSKGIKIPFLVRGSNFAVWFEKFEISAKKLKIPQDEWIQEVLLLCDEDIYELVKSLGSSENEKYEGFKDKILCRLGKVPSSGDAQRKLHNLKQSPDEPLTDYWATLQNLVLKAYPTMPLMDRDCVAINHFTNGISDPSVKEKLMLECPSSFEEALSTAMKIESVKNNLSPPIPCQTIKHESIPLLEDVNAISMKSKQSNLDRLIEEKIMQIMGKNRTYESPKSYNNVALTIVEYRNL